MDKLAEQISGQKMRVNGKYFHLDWYLQGEINLLIQLCLLSGRLVSNIQWGLGMKFQGRKVLNYHSIEVTWKYRPTKKCAYESAFLRGIQLSLEVARCPPTSRCLNMYNNHSKEL